VFIFFWMLFFLFLPWVFKSQISSRHKSSLLISDVACPNL
jgi:hypothetical protein